MIENEISFSRDEVKDEKLEKQSTINWNILSPQLRYEITNYVQLTKLDLNDKVMSIGTDEETYDMFRIVPGPLRMYDFQDNVQLAVTYEFSRSLNHVTRKVYGFLDLLGDLGGLASALYNGGIAVVIILQYKAVISYVSNRLFLIKDGEELQPDSSVHKIHNDESEQFREDDNDSVCTPVTLKRIPISFLSSIKLSFQRLCLNVSASCCKRCHTRRDKLSHMADKLVKEELKIVKWLQFKRTHSLAMKKLFTVSQWKEIEKQARFKTILMDNENEVAFCQEEVEQ